MPANLLPQDFSPESNRPAGSRLILKIVLAGGVLALVLFLLFMH